MSRAPSLLLSATALALLHGACQPPAAPPAARPPATPPGQPPAPCPPRSGEPYVPRPAPGASASLPSPPVLPTLPERDGDAYTVWGIKKALRAPGGASRLGGVDITVVGYVQSTNFEDAPACALHRTGKADPEGCSAPVPSLYLSDDPSTDRWRLRVMGFASSWASLFTARERERARASSPYVDDRWGRVVPSPLPSPGARMRVSGTVSRSFLLSASGVEPELGGILTFREGSYLAPAPSPAALGKPSRPRAAPDGTKEKRPPAPRR